MNALCFVLVLFAIQIIYTREESPVDQNKTASKWMTHPNDHKIDFDEVELFKDYDELPGDHKDLLSASNQSKPPIISTRRDSSKTGKDATAKGNTTSGKIYEDYDISDLHLDKFKLLMSPSKYKTINASHVRFLNRNMSSTGVREESKHVGKPANKVSNSPVLPGWIPKISANNSVTPISWVISPACPQSNESKYVFSAIFDKKPSVHLLETGGGAEPRKETPKIVINDGSITMLVGNATLTNDTYDKMSSSDATKSGGPTKTSHPPPSADNKTTPVTNITHEKRIIEDKLLKGLSKFSMTIQNNTKPQNYVTLSRVGDSLVVSGQTKTHENDEQSSSSEKQRQQQILRLSPNVQADVSIQRPTLKITSQGTKTLGDIPLFLLKNNLLKTPLPGMTIRKTQATPQHTITNILNSELGQRSLFPEELNQTFERPTKKKTVGNLITQKVTDVQSSDLLYDLFKNITRTNVINEDLNRKLLDESQIHTQQNWQLIKSDTDILNVLKNQNKQNGSS